jgi:hypothetical protein
MMRSLILAVLVVPSLVACAAAADGSTGSDDNQKDENLTKSEVSYVGENQAVERAPMKPIVSPVREFQHAPSQTGTDGTRQHSLAQ